MEKLLIKYINVIPEVMLFTLTVLLLLIGCMYKKYAYEKINFLSIISLIIIAAILLFTDYEQSFEFRGMLKISNITQIIKGIIVLSSAGILYFISPSLKVNNLSHFEYPILILFATLGMVFIISANDLIMVFVGIEILSLVLYIIIAMNRNDVYSSEASIKYFILGAISTGLFLFGASYLYGFSGATDFQSIAMALMHSEMLFSYNLIALIMILIALFFKLSLAPFHVWVADIYQGSNTTVTTFLATIPKLAIFILLNNFLSHVFIGEKVIWIEIVSGIALLSMFIGSLGGLFQSNIKRLLAYSAISHIGFVLLVFLGYSDSKTANIINYFIVYIISNIGLFLTILGLTYRNKKIDDIDDLSGLGNEKIYIAGYIAIILFSLIGIPPFAGFFVKLSILKSIVAKELYAIAIFSVVTSVISAAYYLKIIKAMFFNKTSPKESDIIFNIPVQIKVFMAISAIFIMFYSVFSNLFIIAI